MYRFRRNDIIILLGAGASLEATIPHSGAMIKEVEKLIEEDNDWSKFRQLYNYVRSSIYHSDGIHGKFGNQVNYNIERLVNILDEIKQKNEHVLYPFVGAWNPRLVEVAGEDFGSVGLLRNAIVERLRRTWIIPEDYREANYFQGLAFFRKEYEQPLKVFTLNYDLCVEKTCNEVPVERGSNEMHRLTIERGFDEIDRKWDWQLFDDNPDDPKDIFLYKLHGSNDWTYDENENLTYFDDPARIDDKNAAIIFGTSYKLQYRDPFLFLTYEFRKWTLEARIIISIGYGFGDEHINKIIQQALNKNKETLLLSVSPFLDGDEDESNKKKKTKKRKEEISHAIEHRNYEQIIPCHSGAKDFMLNRLTRDYLASLLPQGDELF